MGFAVIGDFELMGAGRGVSPILVAKLCIDVTTKLKDCLRMMNYLHLCVVWNYVLYMY